MRVSGNRKTIQYYYDKAHSILPICVYYALLILPLFYLPDLPTKGRVLRFVVVSIISVVILISALPTVLRPIDIKEIKLSFAVKVMSTLSIFILISWLAALPSTRQIHYGGIDREYMGYISWLTFIWAGYYCRNVAKKLILSHSTLIVMTLVLIISLLYSINNIVYGQRVSGALYDPISFSLYANVVCIATLYHIANSTKTRWKKWLAGSSFIIAVFGVIASQEIIGYLTLAILLIAWTIYKTKAWDLKRFSFLIASALVVLLPIFMPSYFSIYRHESIDQGLIYKADLYKNNLPGMLRHYSVWGQGANNVPTVIDNQNNAPESIIKNLEINLNFSANQDLFFVFAYCFGCLIGLFLIAINIYAVVKFYKSKELYKTTILLLFGVFTINNLVNTPSLEMTSIYLVLLFYMMSVSNVSTRKRVNK